MSQDVDDQHLTAGPEFLKRQLWSHSPYQDLRLEPRSIKSLCVCPQLRSIHFKLPLFSIVKPEPDCDGYLR